MINSEVEKIISSARDKYAVHECGECTYRKCCELGFGSAECLSRRVSISLMLGIEDSFFTKLLDDIEAELKRQREAVEADALAVGGIVEAARHSPGNAAAKRERDEMLDALVRIGNWCAQDLAENTYVSDSSGNYLKTLNGLCEVCRPFMQKARRLKRYGGAE